MRIDESRVVSISNHDKPLTPENLQVLSLCSQDQIVRAFDHYVLLIVSISYQVLLRRLGGY